MGIFFGFSSVFYLHVDFFSKALIVYFVNSSFSYTSFDGSWFVNLSPDKSTIL